MGIGAKLTQRPDPMTASTANTKQAGAAGSILSIALYVTAVWLSGTALWEYAAADFRVMAHLADRQGFVLRDHWLLRTVLHDGLRLLTLLVYVALSVAIWKPLGFLRQLSRRQRLEIIVGITASLFIVSTIKYWSQTSCPWDLDQFGGTALYVSHWDWGRADGGPGRCFPSGHASAGFAFFPLALPMLAATSVSAQKTGWWIFGAVLLFGLLCGLTQVLRGAHYPSHVVWSGLICWGVAVINHTLFQAGQRNG